MLRKPSSPRDEYQPAPSSPAVTTTPTAPQRTVIGEHISIEGDIQGKEDLVIEGSVKGSISLQAHHITVGPKGKVEAEIDAENVTISGQLVGNIKAAGKVEITREADFTGEIKAHRISVEDGAFLKAVIELERESQKKPTPLNAHAEKANAPASKEGLGVAGKQGGGS